LVLALQKIVSRERSPFDPAVVTVGSIHGGSKHNIIASIEHISRGVAMTAGVSPGRSAELSARRMSRRASR
jgi:metal-dependent amidase/aminoacylase/carboxypeptidase family protein